MLKKINFISLIMLFVMTISLPTLALESMKTFNDKKEGFAIEFPENWETKTEFMGTAIISLSPKADLTDTFRENVNVVTEDLPMTMTAKQYYEANLVSMRKMLKEFAVITSSTVTLDGAPAIKMIATHAMGNNKSKNMTFFFTRGKKGFVITCTATPQTYTQYKPVFDTISMSFKFVQ